MSTAKRPLVVTIVAVIAMAVCAWTWSSAAELKALPKMANGNFEDGADGKPKYWQSVGDAAFKWDESASVTPTHSGLIDLTKDNPQGAYWELLVEVEPGTSYRLAGAVKTENLTGKAQVVFLFLDKDGKEIANSEVKLPEVTGAKDWTKNVAEKDSPDSAYFVSIRCIASGKGKAWFDDVSARPAGATVAY